MRLHLSLDPRRVDELAALHLYRDGKPRAAARLLEEAGLAAAAAAEDEGQKSFFSSSSLGSHEQLRGIQEVVAAMAVGGDLAPACRWAEAHREGLQGLGSPLEFQLARLQFLQLLQGDGQQQQQQQQQGNGQQGNGEGDEDFSYDAALAFARERLAPFLASAAPSSSPSSSSPPAANAHKEEVQALMGCLLYAGRLATSPYAHLVLSDRLWQEAMETLHRDGCRLLGVPSESPLSVCYRAALRALGPLDKMRRVVEGSRGGGAGGGDWEALAELPAEIDLGPSLRFHSVFSCPVTRELASPENPPVMLKCGHALCRNSMARLTGRGGGERAGAGGGHGGSGGLKFKCPTCPTEQSVNDARELYF